MRTRTFLTVAASLAIACAHPSARGADATAAECSPRAPETATGVTPDSVPLLAGRFRVINVNTVQGSDFDRVHELELTLRIADSAERVESRVHSIGHLARRDLQLVGRARYVSDTNTMAAEVDAGVLYVGCRGCLDGTPWSLQINAVSSAGLGGAWQLGLGGSIALRVDKHGRELPDPAGYFCAVREAPKSE